jgi:hypothetical protein
LRLPDGSTRARPALRWHMNYRAALGTPQSPRSAPVGDRRYAGGITVRIPTPRPLPDVPQLSISCLAPLRESWLRCCHTRRSHRYRRDVFR